MPLIRKEPAPNAPAPVSVDGLQSDDADKRFAAARALTEEGDVEVLSEALARETNPRVREALFTSLSRIATPKSAAAAAPWIRSDDADVRTAAIDALRAMPSAAAPLLEALLRDEDADVRILSCEIARVIPAAKASAMLCERLREERDVNVVIAAIDVLAEVGVEDASGVLDALQVRFPAEPFLQFAIETAREQLSPPSPRA